MELLILDSMINKKPPRALRNWLLVNDNHKFILCPIPKVAATSLETWFMDSIGKKIIGRKIYKVIREYRKKNKDRFYDLNKLYSYFNKYFSFIVVRNPYNRLISAYINKRWWRKWKTFSIFVDNIPKDMNQINVHIRHQVYYFQGLKYKKIIKLEELYKHENEILKNTNIKHNIPHLIPTKYNNKIDKNYSNYDKWSQNWSFFRENGFPTYSQFYNSKIKKRVFEIYRQDFEALRYAI